VDCHRFYADPDPDQHQNDADPRADSIPSFAHGHVGKSEFYLLLYETEVYSQWHGCHNFTYFEQLIEVFWKKVKNTFAWNLYRFGSAGS
jgi:hypothetical protein